MILYAVAVFIVLFVGSLAALVLLHRHIEARADQVAGEESLPKAALPSLLASPSSKSN
jgi:hypothetical protein